MDARTLSGEARRMFRDGLPYMEAVRFMRDRYALEAVLACNGNYGEAAKRVGLHRNTISEAMRSLGLKPADVRRLAIETRLLRVQEVQRAHS